MAFNANVSKWQCFLIKNFGTWHCHLLPLPVTHRKRGNQISTIINLGYTFLNTHFYTLSLSKQYPWVHICLHIRMQDIGKLQSSSKFNNWQEFCYLPGPPHAQPILLSLVNPQIMWYFSRNQSTSIHVNQIKVESWNNMLQIKSPFGVIDPIPRTYQGLFWGGLYIGAQPDLGPGLSDKLLDIFNKSFCPKLDDLFFIYQNWKIFFENLTI
jgi:hypothetical protein